MKPLLVGEAPSRKSDPAAPFEGRCRTRLEALLGKPLDDVFELRNVLDEWPGASEKGSRFDFDQARERAVQLMRDEWLPRRLLVLAGRRVGRVFAMGNSPYLQVVGFAYPAVVFPHPSGVDRWWNEAENVEAARQFLRAVAARA